MSLLTPPHTAHRGEKENRPVRGSARVVWAAQNQYHLLSSPSRLPELRRAVGDEPPKSILKPTAPVTPVGSTSAARDETPEPSSPQSDATYLLYPVSAITDPTSTLLELNAAYSTLSARLRTTVDESLHPRTDWPLFAPLRDNAAGIMAALVRDVVRALEDPVPADHSARTSLPSPVRSPHTKPKKAGMDADQVKRARDLCTTTHCVIKLLSFLFTQPAICAIFPDSQLRRLLTGILSIPLADELPTLYARKTCALVISLLQSQRLSPEVLRPAAPRIAYAIGRGIDGELGKEGKRGSCNDGLRAIHDLSVYLPEIFVPAFALILPSVFNNLFVTSAGLRLQACHALGGFAIGSTMIPACELHDDLADMARDFLVVNPIKRSPSKSPICNEPRIIRSIRATLTNDDPQNAAQSPVWGISVLAHCVLLLRSRVQDAAVYRVIHTLFLLAKRYNNGFVRCLTGMAWRGVIWGYFQPRLSVVEKPVDPTRTYFTTISNVVDTGCGITLLAGLFSSEGRAQGGHMHRALKVLEVMFQKSCRNFHDALGAIRQLVNYEDDSEWTFVSNRILIPSLYSANPGLLTESFSHPEYSELIREASAEGLQVSDVPPLSDDELAEPEILKSFFECVKKAVGNFTKREEHVIDEVTETWHALIQAYLRAVQDEGHYGVSTVIDYATDLLQEIVQQEGMDWNTITASPTKSSPAAIPRTTVSPTCLRLRILQNLWHVVHVVIAEHRLDTSTSLGLLTSLMTHQTSLVSGQEEDNVEWATLASHVASAGPVKHLQTFWSFQQDHAADAFVLTREWHWAPPMRRLVWKQFAQTYLSSGGAADPEGIVLLLCLPFSCQHGWELGAGEEFGLWEALLGAGIARALDYGEDAVQYVDGVCGALSQSLDPTRGEGAVRVADVVLGRVRGEMSDARSVPGMMVEFCCEALRAGYPPSRGGKGGLPSTNSKGYPSVSTNTSKATRACVWAVRALAAVVGEVPDVLCFDFLDKVQEGVAVWVRDECEVLERGEYAAEIELLYIEVMQCFSRLPADASTLEVFQVLVESVFLGRGDKPRGMFDAFEEVWRGMFDGKVDVEEWPEVVRGYFGLGGSGEEEGSVLEESVAVEEVTVLGAPAIVDEVPAAATVIEEKEEPATCIPALGESLVSEGPATVSIDEEPNTVSIEEIPEPTTPRPVHLSVLPALEYPSPLGESVTIDDEPAVTIDEAPVTTTTIEVPSTTTAEEEEAPAPEPTTPRSGRISLFTPPSSPLTTPHRARVLSSPRTRLVFSPCSPTFGLRMGGGPTGMGMESPSRRRRVSGGVGAGAGAGVGEDKENVSPQQAQSPVRQSLKRSMEFEDCGDGDGDGPLFKRARSDLGGDEEVLRTPRAGQGMMPTPRANQSMTPTARVSQSTTPKSYQATTSVRPYESPSSARPSKSHSRPRPRPSSILFPTQMSPPRVVSDLFSETPAPVKREPVVSGKREPVVLSKREPIVWIERDPSISRIGREVKREPTMSMSVKQELTMSTVSSMSMTRDSPSKRKRSLQLEEEGSSSEDEEDDEPLPQFASMLRRDESFSSKRPRRSDADYVPTFDDDEDEEEIELLPKKELSSDDDPHLGQVTPSHLISPSLVKRRSRRLSAVHFRTGGDGLGSDDSNMGSEDSNSNLGSDDSSMGSDDSIPSSPLGRMVKRRMGESATPDAKYTSLNGRYWEGTNFQV